MKDLNQVYLSGTVSRGCELEYTTNQGVNKYKFMLDIKRTSGTVDTIPIITPLSDIKEGEQVSVEGIYTSYNKLENSKNTLKLQVYADVIEFIEWGNDSNKIVLEGTICKKPIFRTTPFGSQITDILLAVNREHIHKADYIPIILWNGYARKTQNLNVGDRIRIEGRVQSRIYVKEEKEHTAYEVSVGAVEIL